MLNFLKVWVFLGLKTRASIQDIGRGAEKKLKLKDNYWKQRR